MNDIDFKIVESPKNVSGSGVCSTPENGTENEVDPLSFDDEVNSVKEPLSVVSESKCEISDHVVNCDENAKEEQVTETENADENNSHLTELKKGKLYMFY